MATEFHPSVLVSDVYGSAGDVTAVHRDGKVYLRKRRSPGAGQLSPAQVEHLKVHNRALLAWGEVPQEVQEVWNELAREVEPHRPPFDHSSWISGQNLFVSAYHGFYTMGNEHVPAPVRFEPFPSFVVSPVQAVAAGDVLELKFTVAGLEFVEGSRYWLYGKLKLLTPVRGGSSRVPWKSAVASGPCSVAVVSVMVADWRNLWPEVEGLPVVKLEASFVLLDAVTGYRSQRQKMECRIRLSM